MPTDVDVTIAVPGYKPKTFTTKTDAVVTPANKDIKLWPDTIAGELARLQDTKEMLNIAIANRFGETADSSLTIDDYVKMIDPIQNYMVPVYFNFESLGFYILFSNSTYSTMSMYKMLSTIRMWQFKSDYDIKFNHVSDKTEYSYYAYEYSLFIDKRCSYLQWAPHGDSEYIFNKAKTYAYFITLTAYDKNNTELTTYNFSAYDSSNNIIKIDTFSNTAEIKYFKATDLTLYNYSDIAYVVIDCNYNYD